MRGEAVVGVDVGGTKIEAVLMTPDGQVLKRKRIPTLAHENEDIILMRVAKAIRMVTRKKQVRVGISFPGYLDKEGLLQDSPNLPSLNKQPLRQLFHRYIKQPLIIENDANCFALAEQRIGAGKGKEHLVGLIIGTGIGAGIINNSTLMKGKGGAGELGRLPYKDSEIELYAAGPGILKRYFDHGGVKEKAEKIFEKKTLIAKKTLRETVTALTWLCKHIELCYDPEIIVLGGGVSNAPILKDLQQAAKEAGINCPIVRHKLGDAAGAIGAGFLALENL